MSDYRTEERIAYVVTRGTYSDYHIEAVFDNEPAAKDYCAKFDDGYDRPIIEERTLNSTTPHVMAYYEVWVVDYDPAQGRPAWSPRSLKHTTDDWVYARQGYPHALFQPAHRSRVGTYAPTYMARAVHPDEDTARKIAQDLLAQLKYEHQTNGITRLPVEQETE